MPRSGIGLNESLGGAPECNAADNEQYQPRQVLASGEEQRQDPGRDEGESDDLEHAGHCEVAATGMHQQRSKAEPRNGGDVPGEAQRSGREFRAAE